MKSRGGMVLDDKAAMRRENNFALTAWFRGFLEVALRWRARVL
jgi:hypothetical protein